MLFAGVAAVGVAGAGVAGAGVAAASTAATVQKCVKHGVNIVGFTSDGDSRLRRCDCQLMYHMPDPARIPEGGGLMFVHVSAGPVLI